MKKWILLGLLLLSGPSLLMSFDISLSLKAGPGIPFFSGQDFRYWLAYLESYFLAYNGYFVDYKSKLTMSLSAGLSLTLGLFDFLALQPEAIYTRAGGQCGYNDPGGYGEVLYRRDQLNFAELAVLTVIRFGKGRRTLNLFAGPDVAIRIGSVEIKVKQEGYLVAEGSWVESQFAPWFLNLVMGTGITYFLHGGMLFTIEVRYLMGLTSVMNEQLTGLADWKQNDLQFLVGLGWVLAGKKIQRSKVR
jgi:hypothetical protein